MDGRFPIPVSRKLKLTLRLAHITSLLAGMVIYGIRSVRETNFIEISTPPVISVNDGSNSKSYV